MPLKNSLDYYLHKLKPEKFDAIENYYESEGYTSNDIEKTFEPKNYLRTLQINEQKLRDLMNLTYSNLSEIKYLRNKNLSEINLEFANKSNSFSFDFNFKPFLIENNQIGYINKLNTILYITSKKFWNSKLRNIQIDSILKISGKIKSISIIYLLTNNRFIMINNLLLSIEDLDHCLKQSLKMTNNAENNDKFLFISMIEKIAILQDNAYNTFLLCSTNQSDYITVDIIEMINQILNPTFKTNKEIADIFWFYDQSIPKNLNNILPMAFKYCLIDRIYNLNFKATMEKINYFLSFNFDQQIQI